MVDYKLRLGDGTTFSVDEKGLTTWLQGGLVDDKARVQPAGSKKWFTLKQVLAAQGEQRGHAVRQTEKGRADVDRQAAEETAEIERKVAEQRAAEERKAAEELTAAERKAAADRTAAERKIIEEREAAERWAIQEREEEEARLAAERQAEQERAEAERRAAAERAEAERQEEQGREAERLAREAERVAAAEAKVAAERAERAERKRKAEEARLEAEQQAAEEARLAAERKAAEARVAQRKAEEERAAAARREAEAREAAAREAERVAEAERQVAEERAERAERKRRAEEERLAAERAADERAAADRRAAAERAAREREAAVAALHAAAPEPPATDIAIEPAATMVKVEDFERELGLVPVMFDDGRGPAAGREPAGGVADRAPRTPGRERSDGEASLRTDAATGVMKPPTAVDTTVMRLLKVLDRGVVWLVRTVKGMLARGATHGEVAPAAVELPRPVPEPARPAAAVPAPEPARSRPAAATSSTPPPWAAPSVPPPRPQPTPAPSSKQAAAPQRQAAVPPPSFQKLEVIPFAAAPAENREDEEVWGGDDPWQEPGAMASAFSVAWRWTKRVTIAVALIAAVAALALNQQKWMPQAQDAANVLGQNVDKLSERASVRTIPPERIEAARAEIPYLRAQTIELILLKTPGAPEPAEVFRRAHQAVETARPSLPDNVAAEIDNLTGAAAAGLDEAEGEKLRAYLAAMRAGTPSAAYQDKEAVWLMARGTRRLSAEQLARMEELFAQAVTAALQPPV